MPHPSVQILTPPYRVVTLWEPGVVPLTGSIALTQLISEIGVLEATLRGIARRASWLPVVVWTTEEARYQLDIALPSMRALTGAHATLVVPSGEDHPTIMAVLEAVALRPPPGAAHLGAWCALRLGRPDLAPDLTTAMDPIRRIPPRGDNGALRRRLAREGLPPLLALSKLVLLAGAYRLDQPVPRLTRLLGVTAQQLRGWLQRLAGCTLERWVEQPGWEWLVEEMLRRSGTKAARRPLVPGPESTASP